MSQTEVQLVKGLNLDPAAPADATQVDSSGRFLVGTTSSGTGRRLQVEGTDYATSTLSVRRESDDNGGSALELYKSRGSSFNIVSNDDQLGYIRWYGSQGSADAEAARIRVDVDGTPSATSMPGRLLFFTTPSGSTAPAERMRISNSGQVQINLPSNTTSRHIGIVNTSGTIGWTFGNGVTSSTRQFVVYDNEAGAARTVIDSSGNFKFNSGYGSAATAYGVRAWVNFLGTGTVTIRDSGNVSSITDNGTGDYTVNFTTAMPDDDYCVFGSVIGSTTGPYHSFVSSSSNTITTSSFRFNIVNYSGSVPDMDMVSVAVIR